MVAAWLTWTSGATHCEEDEEGAGACHSDEDDEEGATQLLLDGDASGVQELDELDGATQLELELDGSDQDDDDDGVKEGGAGLEDGVKARLLAVEALVLSLPALSLPSLSLSTCAVPFSPSLS